MKTKDSGFPIITLTTDFGARDAYVGAMKGVMYSINNMIQVVDINHEVPAHKLLPAAMIMKSACPYYPEGSIHVGVVDPGVGGNRRPLLLKVDKRYYIGPDNGIFGLLLQDYGFEGAWRLSNPEYALQEVSATFHGRDIFAPAAAWLARGIRPEAFGPPIADPVMISLPACVYEDTALRGEILWIDHFGNCVTNLCRETIEGWARGASFFIEAASETLTRICLAYEEVPIEKGLAVYDSNGFLEIACNQARADSAFGLAEGDIVILRKKEEG